MYLFETIANYLVMYWVVLIKFAERFNWSDLIDQTWKAMFSARDIFFLKLNFFINLAITIINVSNLKG